MRVVQLEQGTDAWLDWRDGGVGSSDAMVIAAAHGLIAKKPWMNSLDALFQEKLNGFITPENDVMRMGKQYEPVARAAFQAETGLVVQPLCGEMDADPRVKASFDGITFDGCCIVEIKTQVYSHVYDMAASEHRVIEYYLPQVCHQGLVAWGPPDAWSADHRQIHFYAYHPGLRRGALVQVDIAEAADFARKLLPYEQAFLDNLAQHVPPCGAEFARLAGRYLALDREIKRLSEAKCHYADGLTRIAAARGTSVDGGGVKVIRTTRAGKVEWKTLVERYHIPETEIESVRSAGATVWQVRCDRHAHVAPTAIRSEAAAAVTAAAPADPFWSSVSGVPST